MKRKLLKQAVVLALVSGLMLGIMPFNTVSPVFENMLTTVMAANGTLTGEGTQSSPYLIEDAEDWAAFAAKVNGGETTACAKLTADIETAVTDMVGTSTSKYSGTFDGVGHTLTLNLASDGDEYTAPFRYVNGATVNRLHTVGTINDGSQKYATGLIYR